MVPTFLHQLGHTHESLKIKQQQAYLAYYLLQNYDFPPPPQEKHKNSITYLIPRPPVGNCGSLAVRAYDLFHVFETRVRRYRVSEWRKVVFHNATGLCSPAHFPKNQTKGIDVGFLECFETFHIYAETIGIDYNTNLRKEIEHQITAQLTIHPKFQVPCSV